MAMMKTLTGNTSVSLLSIYMSDSNKYWITIVSDKGYAYHSYMSAAEAMEIVRNWNLNNEGCILVKIATDDDL